MKVDLVVYSHVCLLLC